MSKNQIEKLKLGEGNLLTWLGVFLVMGVFVWFVWYLWFNQLGPLKPVLVKWLPIEITEETPAESE